GAVDHSETVPSCLQPSKLSRSGGAIELALPLRYTLTRHLAGEMGRSGAIRPAIANTSAAVARNAWPIRDLLMPSTFDTVANIISQTFDIPRDPIKPANHPINHLPTATLPFL